MNHVTFHRVSDRTNDQDRHTLEPIWDGFESSFNENDDEELSWRLDELCEHYEHLTNVSVDALDVTRWLPYGEYLEAYPLRSGATADDIRDIRRRIELPEGVMFTDCQFFVLYPNSEEDKDEMNEWLVLLPQVR